ncbi:MAG: hypothetical protein D6744_18215 [Planctomycetota bacterium]|nr:MAG: hypothetical protein D6744_18215 [Planctomycetota bacterium]
MRNPITIGLIAAAIATCGVAIAQDAPQAGPLDELKTKPALTDEERAALKEWLTQRISAVVNNNAPQAAAELRANYDGTDSFKEAYVAIAVELVKPVVPRADVAPAAQLVALLGSYRDMKTFDLLLDALKDKRPAVRSASAVALRGLQSKIAAAGGGEFARSVAALRDAAKVETSAPALRLMYRALDYATLPADVNTLAAAVLDILEARSKKYRGDQTPAWAADRPGLRLAGKLAGRLNETDKDRLIAAAARILRAGVLRYAAEKLDEVEDDSASADRIELRNATEYLIVEAENLLASLLGVSNKSDRPNVAQKLTSERDPIAMKTEMNRWADMLQTRMAEDFHTFEADDAAP